MVWGRHHPQMLNLGRRFDEKHYIKVPSYRFTNMFAKEKVIILDWVSWTTPWPGNHRWGPAGFACICTRHSKKHTASPTWSSAPDRWPVFNHKETNFQCRTFYWGNQNKRSKALLSSKRANVMNEKEGLRTYTRWKET